MQHLLVHRHDDRYVTFPALAKAADGSVLCVFREAGEETARAAKLGQHTHQDLDSRILLSVWRDGSGWSEPRLVCHADGYAVSDPALTILNDGRWLVRFARWKMVPSRDRHLLGGPVMRHFVRTGQVGTLAGNGFVISADQGASWQALPGTMNDPDWASAVSREAAVELADGALVLAVYCGYPVQTECAGLARSFDGGATWGDVSPIAGSLKAGLPYRGNASFNETSVVALDDTTLLALVRSDTSYVTDGDTFISEGGVGELQWTISFDAGFTWETPRPTGIWGQPAHALRLADGRILATFGHRRQPFGIQAALCELGQGFRVTKRIILRDDAAGWDCGYPSTVALDDGSLLTAYYTHGADGVRHVAATRWRLDEMTEA